MPKTTSPRGNEKQRVDSDIKGRVTILNAGLGNFVGLRSLWVRRVCWRGFTRMAFFGVTDKCRVRLQKSFL